MTPDGILDAAARFSAENPRARPRTVAAGIDVSEAALVAAGIVSVSGPRVTRLTVPDASFFASLDSLGPLMALTRTEGCVLEQTGHYGPPAHAPDGTVRFDNDGVGLTVRPEEWAFGFFVDEGDKQSFQFFDRSGTAVHKVYAREGTDLVPINELGERVKCERQDREVKVEPTPPPRPAASSGREAPLDAHRAWFEDAAISGKPISISVENRGCGQYFDGPIYRLSAARGWFNVLDPGFNMHLQEQIIGAAVYLDRRTLRLYDISGRPAVIISY
ncbi:hemin-degrading factor [soil metagenome]